ncbi:glycosyltransferase [soil metagenome]
MRKIVLTTIGTLGDLHPFIAIALALKSRGFTPILAVAEDQVAKARAAGIDAVAVLPGFRAICQRMGLSEDEAARRIMANQRQMLEQVILPAIETCANALDSITDDAEAIVASNFVFAAPIIAAKRDLPLVSVILQPMAMLSPHDPPGTPDFAMMRKKPSTAMDLWWNRLFFAAVRELMHGLYGKRIDSARAAHGLLPRGGRRMFDAGREAALTLCCYSPLFGPTTPDAPASTRVVGFPVFDSASGAVASLDPALESFLSDGAPPVVFTLGTFAVHGAEAFYAVAEEAARRMGERAVLLTGREGDSGRRDGVFRCAYAPHSLLFPRSKAIVHHGGIGTTGQALRAGKPQLVVPHMGDQYDHARRIAGMGVGRSLSAGRFTAKHAEAALRALLNDRAYSEQARRVRGLISHEDGASAAASAIRKLLAQPARTIPGLGAGASPNFQNAPPGAVGLLPLPVG